jgi:beta-galactosidase
MKRYILILLAVTAFFAESAAREVYSLNNNWRFFFKEENSSDEARFVRLPHTWNLDALSEGGSYRQTVGNYEHSLFVPAEWRGKRIFLRFGGVQSVADVFVNGSHVGEHRGG